MMQLLVSVRSAAECRQVVEAGVDVIDLKEPLRGSLGAPDSQVLRDVAEVVAGRCPLSVALGEVLDEEADGQSRGEDLPPTVGYAKFGLSGSESHSTWREAWAAAWERLPASVCRVAVAYVDQGPARCAPWRSILAEGTGLGCGVLLLDTFDKSRGGLRFWMTDKELLAVREATADRGVKLALAGSLQVSDLSALRAIHPDLVAVRSAVCEGGRTGPLSLRRLAEVREQLRVCGVA